MPTIWRHDRAPPVATSATIVTTATATLKRTTAREGTTWWARPSQSQPTGTWWVSLGSPRRWSVARKCASEHAMTLGSLLAPHMRQRPRSRHRPHALLSCREHIGRCVGILACTLGVLVGGCGPERCPQPARAALQPLDQHGEADADGGLPICDIVPNASRCLEMRARVPRCAPSDPNCGPEAVGDRCYRPSAPRKPFGPQIGRHPELACTHDGECTYGRGCGAACISYRTPAHQSLCGGTPGLEGAFCGCVQGQCALFVQ
jgi:hypothetical protein